MKLIELFSTLPPFVQFATIVGIFLMIFLVAFNRTAASNLVRFLNDLYVIFFRRSYERHDINQPERQFDNNERNHSPEHSGEVVKLSCTITYSTIEVTREEQSAQEEHTEVQPPTLVQ